MAHPWITGEPFTVAPEETEDGPGVAEGRGKELEDDTAVVLSVFERLAEAQGFPPGPSPGGPPGAAAATGGSGTVQDDDAGIAATQKSLAACSVEDDI